MKRTGRILGRALFGAAVAAALGFGARQAVAAQDEARLPYCRDQLHCQSICDAKYPGLQPFGICSTQRTCYCKLEPSTTPPILTRE